MLPVPGSPPPFSESVVNACAAGDLAERITASQLRDSTGLAPVSPLSLSIRGLRHLAGTHSIVNALIVCQDGWGVKKIYIVIASAAKRSFCSFTVRRPARALGFSYTNMVHFLYSAQ